MTRTLSGSVAIVAGRDVHDADSFAEHREAVHRTGPSALHLTRSVGPRPRVGYYWTLSRLCTVLQVDLTSLYAEVTVDGFNDAD